MAAFMLLHGSQSLMRIFFFLFLYTHLALCVELHGTFGGDVCAAVVIVCTQYIFVYNINFGRRMHV